MDSPLDTAVSECVSILQDRCWHDVYEFHQKYRLSALEIFQAVDILLQNTLIEKVGYKVRLKTELSNTDLAVLNKMKKTKRPTVLAAYEPKYLTRSKNRV